MVAHNMLLKCEWNGKNIDDCCRCKKMPLTDQITCFGQHVRSISLLFSNSLCLPFSFPPFPSFSSPLSMWNEFTSYALLKCTQCKYNCDYIALQQRETSLSFLILCFLEPRRIDYTVYTEYRWTCRARLARLWRNGTILTVHRLMDR